MTQGVACLMLQGKSRLSFYLIEVSLKKKLRFESTEGGKVELFCAWGQGGGHMMNVF